MASALVTGMVGTVSFHMRRSRIILSIALGVGIGLPILSVPQAVAAPAGNCKYVYSETGGTPTVSSAAGTAKLATDVKDAANPKLRGTLGGKSLTVVLWKGVPVKDAEASTAAAEKDWADLAAKSLAGATKGDTAKEVTAELSTSSDLGEMETIAATITDGTGSTDFTTLGAHDALVDTKTGAKGVKCLRAASTAKVASIASGSEFAFPVATAAAVTAAAAVPNSIVRYRTFIPVAKVDSNTPCGIFKGDNRGFTSSYTASSSRTYAAVVYHWSTKGISTAKYVSATKRLNSAGTVIDTATASSSGIGFYSPVMSASYGRIQVNHAVGNPLCAISGPISYSVVIEDWKSGGTRIMGNIKKVPNHEANVYPVSETYGDVIFRRTGVAFFCLSTNCGNESINVSVS